MLANRVIGLLDVVRGDLAPEVPGKLRRSLDRARGAGKFERRNFPASEA
jgi:hypothetical protein